MKAAAKFIPWIIIVGHLWHASGFAGSARLIPDGQEWTFTAPPGSFAIPDGVPAGLSRTLSVSGVALPIALATVSYRISYPTRERSLKYNDNDLTVTLTSPGGKMVVLHDRFASASGVLGQTHTICENQGLRDFNDEDVNGNWSLTVVDNEAPGLDVGASLEELTLSFRDLPTATIDLTMSVMGTADATKRDQYEAVIGKFAEALFQSTQGAHRVGNVDMYTNGRAASRADVVWGSIGWPNVPCGQDYHSGLGRIHMFETWDKGTELLPLIGNANPSHAGYTLAHEWGHYFYGLYDQYLSGDSPVYRFLRETNSLMADQLEDLNDRRYLSHSIHPSFRSAFNRDRKTGKNFKIYGASEWDVLQRFSGRDPNIKRTGLTGRFHYPELALSAPIGEGRMMDLAQMTAPNIRWRDDEFVVQLVLDQSPSMVNNGSQKLAQAKAAAQLVVDQVEEGTWIEVLAFSSSVQIVHELSQVQSEGDRTAIKTAIGSIAVVGGTDIGQAATTGLNRLVASGHLETKEAALFLLTDGESSYDAQAIGSSAADLGVRIHTIGFGNDADFDGLKTLAAESGGSFQGADENLNAVSFALTDAAIEAKSAVHLADDQLAMEAGQQSIRFIDVDGSILRLVATIATEGSAGDSQIELRRPDNVVVTEESVTELSGETLRTFIVDQPLEGTWQIAVSAGMPGFVRYRVIGHASGPSFDAVANERVLEPESYPLILSFATSREHPISGLTTDGKAIVTSEAGAGIPKVSTDLFFRDDGVYPDTHATDGVYHAAFYYPVDGEYDISINTSNLGAAKFYPRVGCQATSDHGRLPAALPPIPISERFSRALRFSTPALPPPPLPDGIHLISPFARKGVDSTGGVFSLEVIARGDWNVVVSAQAPWITVDGLADRSGSGTVAYQVAPNPTPNVRTGNIRIGDRIHSVQQEGHNPTPMISNMKINGGASETDRVGVSVSVDVADGTVSEFRFGSTSDLSGAPWMSRSVRSSTLVESFQLSGGFGAKIVYAQVRGPGGESSVLSDSIQYVQGDATFADLVFGNRTFFEGGRTYGIAMQVIGSPDSHVLKPGDQVRIFVNFTDGAIDLNSFEGTNMTLHLKEGVGGTSVQTIATAAQMAAIMNGSPSAEFLWTVPPEKSPTHLNYLDDKSYFLLAQYDHRSNNPTARQLIHATSAAFAICDGSGLIAASPATIEMDSGGGTTTVDVAGSDAWCADESSDWFVLQGDLEQIGNGSFEVAVEPNTTGSSRSGSITINGQSITVTQMETTFPNLGAPPEMQLSNASILENLPTSSVVGTLTTTPMLTGATYALADSGEFPDNALFSIIGSELRSAFSFDYEDRAVYSVLVRATDSGGQMVEAPWTVTIVDDGSEDGEGDGVTQDEERDHGSRDNAADSDGDGASDREEIDAGTDPSDNRDVPSRDHWLPRHKLLAADGTAGDRLGWSIGASEGRVLCGAVLDDPHGNDSGSAYIFDQDTGTERHKLVPDDGVVDARFGFSVALDADRALIGAPGDDDNGSGSGSAYVFDAATGQLIHKVVPSDGAAGDQFGEAVALDGNWVVVGAPFHPQANGSLGAVYVFDLSTGVQLHKLSGPSTARRFGHSVTIHNGKICIGAPDTRNQADTKSVGSIYVANAGNGSIASTLLPDDLDTMPNDAKFGWRVLVRDDLVIGAAINDATPTAPDVGSVYGFDLISGEQVFKVTPPDGTQADDFGYGIALSGRRLLVGAHGHSNQQNAGAVYAFGLDAGELLAKIEAEDGVAGDHFGLALAACQNVAIVGAFGDDENGSSSGSAYVIEIEPFTAVPPSDIVLAEARLPENQLPGGAVGNLHAIHPDGDESIHFSLVSGDGAEDNHLFGVLGRSLITRSIFDHEAAPTRSIRVRATGATGLEFEESIQITVEDLPEGFFRMFNPSGMLSQTDGSTPTFILGETQTVGLNVPVFAATEGPILMSLDAPGFSAHYPAQLIGGDTGVYFPEVHFDGNGDVGVNRIQIRSAQAQGSSYVDAVILPSRTWADWADSMGLQQAAALPLSNPAGDGIVNLLKYAFNLDASRDDTEVLRPGTGTKGLPQIAPSQGGQFLRFEFIRRRISSSQLIYEIQTSTDLLEWDTSAGDVTTVPIDANWERVIAEVALADSDQSGVFGRLKVRLRTSVD